MAKNSAKVKSSGSPQQEMGMMLKVNVASTVKAKFKAICAVKQLKMGMLIGSMIKEYVDKNESVLHE